MARSPTTRTASKTRRKPASTAPRTRSSQASKAPLDTAGKDTAAPAAKPRRRRVSLPSLESGATLLRKVVLNAIFVIAVVLFFAVMVAQFLREQVVIEPIAVPKALIAQGLSPEVVAGRLWDGLRDAQLRARTAKASLSAIPDSQRIQFTVPEVGLSLDSIVRQTRQFFNLHQARIGGEIVCADTACTPEGMQLRLRILKGGSEIIDLPPLGNADQRGYFTDAAVEVLGVLDPFVAAAALADRQPVRAATLARRLVRQHHPDAKWAQNLLGNLASNAQNHEGAVDAYRAALDLDPGFVIAQANLGRALRQAGDLDGARQVYDALAQRDPDYPALLEGQAELQLAEGSADAAIALLQKAAELDPGSAHFFARIGQIEAERGNGETAQDWFRRALQIDPAYPLALEPVFIALVSSGRLEEGEALLGAAARYRPAEADTHALHAAALTFLGRQQEALDAFDRALLITPDDFDLLYQSAGLLQELDRLPEAIDRFGRAIALRPYDPAARFGRGSALAVTGDNANARIDLERVLDLDTTGTQYGNLARGFLDILDGLDAAQAEAPPTEEAEGQ
jgi:tetratricopeptide (TPR) repeat protein